MKKIRQWMNGLSVKAKLICYGYLFITPVLVVICLILLANNYSRGIEKRLENDRANADTLADSINLLQTDIKDFSTYICINQEIQSLLKVEEPNEYNKNARLWQEEAPMMVIQDMIALKGHIKTIAIYAENGIRPYLQGMDGSVYLSSTKDVRETETYRETIESESGMIWKSVPKGSGDTYLTNREDKVVLYREIFDLSRKKTMGYIVIGVSQTKFQGLCENMLGDKKESILVLNPDSGVLSRAGAKVPKVEEYLTGERFLRQDYRKRETHIRYENYDIVCSQPERNASIVCKISPCYELQMQFFDIAYMPLALLLGMLAGLLPLLLIISNVVTMPLRKVSDAIRKFSDGDFEQQVEVITDDEVGEVAKCFNKMVEDIRALIDENYVKTLAEKESELAALQAQINPHFLYNTLDTLYWQATEEGNEEIAENILALSQLFRLALSNGEQEVSVGQEAELISRYLQIQKMRFTKRLAYEVDIDEGIRKVRIPKLILQPFVENAVVHGFENVSTPCRLKVTGRMEQGMVVFHVWDTGIGMRQDQIEAIWEEESRDYAKQRIGRYAIKNIRERLQLRYHDRFSLEIRSSIGKGTEVILKIPYEEGAACR